MTRQQATRELVSAAAALKVWSCFPATDGNLSARLASEKILITKRGITKGDLRANCFVVQALRGERAAETSTEWFMHREIYVARAEVNCVLHVHAPFLTAFAAAHRVPNRRLLTEANITLGEMVLVPYEEPGSEVLGRALLHSSKTAAVYLLSNHGVVAVGSKVQEAQHSLERAEFLAQVELLSESLGGGHLIQDDKADKGGKTSQRQKRRDKRTTQ